MNRYLITAAWAMAVAAAPAAAQPGAATAPRIEQTRKIVQGGLYEIVHNPADGRLYIAATGPRGSTSAKIVALDGGTLADAATIDVSATPLFGLGLNTRTQTLYGTDTRAGDVSAIDLRSGAVSTFRLAGSDKAHVREVIVDEKADKAYVTVVGGTGDEAKQDPNQIWVVDGATKRVERAITVPTGSLTGAALDPASGRLFVTGMGSNEVVAIDLKTDRVVARWPAGGEQPTNIAFDAAGKRLFVANQGSGDLTVLDAKSGAQKAKVATGKGALSVAFNPRRQHIYVANRGSGTVTVVDAKRYAVLADLATGTFPQSIAIDRATDAVYITNKARGLPRDAPAGTPVPEDPAGDTVVLIRP